MSYISNQIKTWHERHNEERTVGQRLADAVAAYMGSWHFIILQSVLVFVWIVLNLVAYTLRWDPYPFILLNLLFSTQAAYAAPIIMMSQNRQGERDRVQALDDYETNKRAKEEIEELQQALARIEDEKLKEIISLLHALKGKQS
ncbi:MAG: DUF1003 domain-containing protein [Patescibacteria group bacterium]|jgi:uncharacterized membrane protein